MRKPWLIISLFLMSTSAMAADVQAKSSDRTGPISLDLYVMSLCPFGVQAENSILPAVKLLGQDVKFSLHFMGSENPKAPKDALATARFNSLHGPSEVEEDLRQVCARKYFPDRYAAYILERNKTVQDPNWKEAAAKAGLDSSRVEACAAGIEGTNLLSEDMKAAVVRKATGSPTIDVDGSPYAGPRSERAVALAVCDALKNRGAKLPEACQRAEAMAPDIPAMAQGAGCGQRSPQANTPSVPFDLQVVIDRQCKACQATLTDTLKQLHPGARVKMIYADSKQGQALIREMKATSLPLYVLDQTVEKDPNAKAIIDQYYSKVGDKYLVRAGSTTYDPTIRLDRPRSPHQLDIFVEPLSPFTMQAEGEFLSFLNKTRSKTLTFSLHFIVPEEPSGPANLRHEEEVQESIRQACLFQHAPMESFFSYVGCRNANQTDAGRVQACMPVSTDVNRCIAGAEGRNLLAADMQLAHQWGVSSGPAMLWETHYGPFGWDAVVLKDLVTKVE